MSLSVKRLKEQLKSYRDDAIVVNHEGADFIHSCTFGKGDLLLSVEKPIGYCSRGSGYVYPTSVEDYVGVSPELDENVDLGEIILPNLDEEKNKNKFGIAEERASKYKSAFYDLLKIVENSLTQDQWEELYKHDINLTIH